MRLDIERRVGEIDKRGDETEKDKGLRVGEIDKRATTQIDKGMMRAGIEKKKARRSGINKN